MAAQIKAFIGETLIYGVANVFSRLFAMLLIPIYTYYLTKDDYSNIVMLQSVFSMLTFLLGLNSGVFYYYYEYENVKYRKLVFSSWFYYEIVVAMAIFLSLALTSDFTVDLFVINDSNRVEMALCIILMGLQFFPYLFNNTNINFFRIERKPKKVMYITLLEALFTVSFISFGLEFWNFGLTEIVLSQFVARSIATLFFVKTIKFYISISAFSFPLLKKMFAFSWPFLVISIFQWLILSIDKFIGASVLSNTDEIAFLSLGMQLALPITVLADMIRMAIGPFVMSIRKDKDADQNYQQIFDLSIYISLLILIGLVCCTPFLIGILADDSYKRVLEIIPLLALANIISLIGNQFAISFSLVKKNIFILYATIIAGILGFGINYFLMPIYGYLISGYSQIISYIVMAVFLFFYGRRIANMNIKFKYSAAMLAISLLFVIAVYFFLDSIYAGNIFYMLVPGLIASITLSLIYIRILKLHGLKLTLRRTK